MISIANSGAVLKSELTKIRTLRSAVVSLALMLAVSVILGGISGWSVARAINTDNPSLLPDFTPEAAGFDALFYGEVALIVFAVVTVTHEFSSGMIRQSFTAVPNRTWFYTAKLAAAAIAALAVVVPAVPLTYLATQAGLGAHGSTIGAPTVPSAILGGIAFMVLTTVFCGAVAMLVRTPVVALSVLLPAFFVISPLLNALQPTKAFAQYLPDRMGLRMVATGADITDGLSPSAATLVMLAWTVAAVIGGALVVRRIEV
jgi:ABC-2 type transport system permease protein